MYTCMDNVVRGFLRILISVNNQRYTTGLGLCLPSVRYQARLFRTGTVLSIWDD